MFGYLYQKEVETQDRSFVFAIESLLYAKEVTKQSTLCFVMTAWLKSTAGISDEVSVILGHCMTADQRRLLDGWWCSVYYGWVQKEPLAGRLAMKWATW